LLLEKYSFFLQVINLENVATAQAGVNLFPSANDYQPEYNGILRVGIAFSMWMATGRIIDHMKLPFGNVVFSFDSISYLCTFLSAFCGR
jgi:hypothetical protein